MALQSSGAISLSDIQTEFTGSNPISLSEYYGRDAGVPESGAISIGDFYGTQRIRGTTSSPTFYWLVAPDYTNRLYWNGTQITSGFSSTATTLTVGSFTYTRHTLFYTTYLKSSRFDYYEVSRAA